MEEEKKFIIIGNMNCITYKEVFPLIMNNKIWLGIPFPGGNAYFRPAMQNDYAVGVYDEDTNLVKFRNCIWLTNVDHGRRHQPLSLMTMADNLRYSKHKEIRGKAAYDHYDNYDAIEVPFTDAIPSDYDGVMGVPISFLDKYCPEQFEIFIYNMTQHNTIKLFEEKKVRAIWDDKDEKWYFSIVDVVAILTESINATSYWRKLKQRLKAEGNETVTNCHGLKMLAADGKIRLTDVADTEQLFRLIQSIPSHRAEPFKLWMAQAAAERLDQMQDPELSINQALTDYKRLGYSDNWINQRLKSIEIRKDLTNEWKRHGLREGMQFATLTDIIYQTWSDMTAKEYKKFKGLKKENLRDNMTNKELVLNMLAELSTKEISESKQPETFGEHIEKPVVK